MDRKMMYALAAVVAIIVIVAVAGAYVLMNNGGGNTAKVADATSLQYNADVSYQGATPVVFTWTAKNVGATNMVLRIDLMGGASGNYTYIMDHGAQTVWWLNSGTWTNLSSDFTNQWSTWVGTGKQWTNNLNHLTTDWSGTGDCTYAGSSTNTTIRIYNVVINPTLADSLFQHAT